MSKTVLTTSELLVLSGCARRSGETWMEAAVAHPEHGGDPHPTYKANAEYMFDLRVKLERMARERGDA